MRILYIPNSYSQQRQREKKANIYPVRMAMEAEFYRKQEHQVFWKEIPKEYRFNWGSFVDKVIYEPEDLTFSMLPHPDRVWTKAKYFTSGNYKYLPGTHIMSASGCWWGKCSFCVENTGGKIHPYQTHGYEVRPVDDVISEIEECKQLGFKEVFDDSATFPQGEWLNDFTKKLAKLNMHFSCNMRIDSNVDYRSLFNAGFRMLLYGVESANEETLNRIGKGINADEIIPTIKKASEAGLEPHICVIFGHPNETDKDALNTLTLTHYLLRKGYAKTAQASFYCVKGEQGNESQRHFVKDIYGVWKYPDFWFSQIKDIKNKDDLKYLWRKIKVGLNG